MLYVLNAVFKKLEISLFSPIPTFKSACADKENIKSSKQKQNTQLGVTNNNPNIHKPIERWRIQKTKTNFVILLLRSIQLGS